MQHWICRVAGGAVVVPSLCGSKRASEGATYGCAQQHHWSTEGAIAHDQKFVDRGL